ncbi:oligoendopeptidase, pepF/M3 family [Amphibacillus marinus]|uniref:Oligoendopeptidase, pepF/M3 family n=1 Tax=Amphibacillus marinus TaxID=872970 RepID=A0A1H8ICV3_9BACI|nr:M3 family oligoendopeptidase [Amphibacillus marinus]SEN65987.1 oligoendopeptidase, pepF/M3 family [Amphibacillus marinus]
MKQDLKQTWDLEQIFQGGSSSTLFQSFIKEGEAKIVAFSEKVNYFNEGKQLAAFKAVINALKESGIFLGEISSFISCLSAQDVTDKHVKELIAKKNRLSAAFKNEMNYFSFSLTKIPDQEWAEWLADSYLVDVHFVLAEYRQEAKEKLSEAEESIITDLSIDGYHGWGEMYDTIVAGMEIEWEGELQSVGQIANQLNNPDRTLRKRAFEKYDQAWQKHADLFADTLNHLAGFRLQMYKHRNWQSVLKEPLTYNRMSERTLASMWQTIIKNKSAFHDYFDRKAKLLGIAKLSWYDLDAPIFQDTKVIGYQQAAENIVEQFGKISPKMADYAVKAFENNWIEAEDRSGKRPGGFCTSFPKSKQTRIFMTYSGSASNVATLAHELGHGYHQYVLDDLDPLNQNYAMNVAETASTLAELIVADSAVKQAKSLEEQISLVEDKIQRSVAFFMNIHARFLFETRFYELRKVGYVSAGQLNQLMEEAQREAYDDQLDQYDPSFWASKLHFYITDVPFYNFPYTFGYLFSLGIYAFAKKEPAQFESFYDCLLRDTGKMTVEDLAQKHLSVDLSTESFWQGAIDLCTEDINLFLTLTKSQ